MGLKLLECPKLMRLFYACCFVCFSSSIFGQIRLKGIITDSAKIPLSYANIQILQGEKNTFITHGITDEKGAYTISLKKAGTYKFKVSFLGYKTIVLSKKITKSDTVNFTMLEDTAELKPIVIKGQSADIRIKNDTLKYNLKHFVNGREENLKDILNKLPGVTQENGKIKVNGKTIDHLLIDGKEFFKGQHQLATENISSQMVKGVALVKNFKDFSNIENTDQTALNISIKGKYKGKIGGNFRSEGGYENKYRLHTNLYKFDKKTTFFFIGDLNNLGKQAFTIQDYISFLGSVNALSNKVTNGYELPSFLFPKQDIKTRNTQFSAINFSATPTKKINLRFFSIFNKVREEGFSQKNSTFFTNNTPITYNENIKDTNKSFLNNTFLTFTYKPNNKTILNYTMGYAPLKNNLQNEIVINTSDVNQVRKPQGFSLKNYLKYTQQITEKSFLSAILHFDILKNDNTIAIDADRPFLNLPFQNNNFKVVQNTIEKNNSYGLNIAYTLKIQHNVKFRFTADTQKRKNSYQTVTTNNKIKKNDIKQSNIDNTLGITFIKKDHKLLNYNIGFKYVITNIQSPEKHKVTRILPKIGLTLNFGKTHYLNLTYKQTATLPLPKKLIKNSLIENYRTMFLNPFLVADNLSEFQNFNIRYLNHDLFSRTLLTLLFDYNKGKNVLTTNSINQSDFVINQNVVAPSMISYNLFVLLDKKLGGVPFSLRFKGGYSFLESNNYVNAIPNEIKSKKTSADFKIASLFKKFPVDFEAGFKLTNSKIVSQLTNVKTKLFYKAPYLNLSSTFRNFLCKVNFLIEDYTSKNQERINYLLSPKIIFKKPKSNWAFNLQGDNLLKINNTEQIENTVFNNMIENKIYSTLSGYIVFGIKYTL